MDTVGQFLTRIRNAGMAKHEKVDIPSSKLRANIAQVLLDNGYIRSFKSVRDDKQGMMRVYLKYNSKGQHVINNLQRISRPGRRFYVQSQEIPKVRSGFGLTILSTNKGVMSGDQAAKENLGGEVLCQLW